MGRAALKKTVEPVDVQLTIVPTEFDDVDPNTADDLLTEEPAPRKTRRPVAVAKPAPTPTPAPRRTGLLVASAMGGGMVIGGGAVGVIALLAGVLAGGALLVGGGAALWMSMAPSAEVPVAVEAPAAEPAPIEATTGAPPVADTTTTPKAPAPKAPATSTPSAPAAPTGSAPAPAPAETPATTPSAPVATTPVAPAAPAGKSVVKIITDPPAARIVVDGEDMGRSPAKLELEAGAHQLTIESGKLTGTFPFDAGIDAAKLCFAAQGRKLAQVGCP